MPHAPFVVHLLCPSAAALERRLFLQEIARQISFFSDLHCKEGTLLDRKISSDPASLAALLLIEGPLEEEEEEEFKNFLRGMRERTPLLLFVSTPEQGRDLLAFISRELPEGEEWAAFLVKPLSLSKILSWIQGEIAQIASTSKALKKDE